MEYDVIILQGIAELTRDWEYRKDALFGFMCERGGDRWSDTHFKHHMYAEYIKSETPITLRLYALDADNRRLVLQYVRDVLMGGMASEMIEL